MNHLGIAFAPLLPPFIIGALAVCALLLLMFAASRRARGTLWRAAGFALLALALCNPSLIEEQRAPLKDKALIVVDDSASMRIGDRAQQALRAADALVKKLGAFPDLETDMLHVTGSTETDLFHAIEAHLSSIPHDRLAGIILITDGEIHDLPQNKLNAPLHALIAGQHDEIDRRIAITQAPAYGIVGKTAAITLRVEDEPSAQSQSATVIFRHDGGSETLHVPVGKDFTFQAPVDHAGPNLFAFSVEPLAGEITALNNDVAVGVNGIRDRLRVLLVSGEPHIGERTWRNFLKSDPAVDLIHFTILRPPGKMDAIPNNELSLIAFPVQELFETKLSSFDLVIFDRFREQSLIPDNYLENVARYVENGGALLISNATDEEIPALTLSPLARVLPTEPDGRLLTGRFVPDITATGERHPVTDSLTRDIPHDRWGPWFRQTGARTRAGEVLMTGLQGEPLLVLNRVGQGRVAQFLSDEFWLWARNYEGGGPQAELLRRTAHWLVGEPELDETALRAAAAPDGDGWNLHITKRSLHEDSAAVSVTGPDDKTADVTLAPGNKPGILEAAQHVEQIGLYRLKSGADEILAFAGPENAPEFGAMVATDAILKPVVTGNNGGIFWLADHPDGPDIRRTQAGGAQQGWGWIGLRKQNQYRITGSKAYPLMPVWLAVIVLLGVMMLGWRREGRS